MLDLFLRAKRMIKPLMRRQRTLYPAILSITSDAGTENGSQGTRSNSGGQQFGRKNSEEGTHRNHQDQGRKEILSINSILSSFIVFWVFLEGWREKRINDLSSRIDAQGVQFHLEMQDQGKKIDAQGVQFHSEMQELNRKLDTKFDALTDSMLNIFQKEVNSNSNIIS